MLGKCGFPPLDVCKTSEFLIRCNMRWPAEKEAMEHPGMFQYCQHCKTMKGTTVKLGTVKRV